MKTSRNRLTGRSCWLSLLLLFSCCLVCCRPNLLLPTSREGNFAHKRWADTNRQTLEQGYTLYITKCGGCHEYHAPSEYSEDDWIDILHKMARKAHLQNGEEEIVRRYIVVKMLSGSGQMQMTGK